MPVSVEMFRWATDNVTLAIVDDYLMMKMSRNIKLLDDSSIGNVYASFD